MEKIINDIILFDKEFDSYKKLREEEIENENQKFEISLKDILEEEEKLIENEKKNILLKYDEMLKKESLDILEKSKKDIELLKNNFENVKLSISKEIFKTLIDLRN